jgi:nickel-type superoxide dismutase maturation protease
MREAALTDRILLMLGRVSAVRVSGDSMRPTLADGDLVLVKKTRNIATRDIVLAAHPFKSSVRMLKRVDSIDAAGQVELLGDNRDDSSDSRSFGKLPSHHVCGRVICRLSRR